MGRVSSSVTAELCARLMAGCANYQSPQERSGMLIGGRWLLRN